MTSQSIKKHIYFRDKIEMHLSETTPNQSGYGDLFSVFAIILAVALSFQAFSELRHYYGLRNGIEVEGRWVDNYIEPKTSAPTVVYSFTVAGQSYRARQVVSDYITDAYESGDSVAIIYLSNNPEISRLAGTVSFSYGYLVQLLISSIIIIFAVQYYFALTMQRTAWALVIWTRLRGRQIRVESSIGERADETH